MSRLQELITELCPDGVEYKPLGDLCSIVTKQTGFDYTNYIKKSLLRNPEPNSIPYIQTKFFSGKQFNYDTDYYVPQKTFEQFPKITLNSKCILFSIVGSIGNVGLFSGERTCFLGGAICVAKVLPQYNAEYIYYCTESYFVQKQIASKIKGAGQTTITVEDVRQFLIPFPSLPVQHEIVRILDSFSGLAAELSAELTARKKQYEYYKELIIRKILSDNSEYVQLCQIADVRDGTHDSPKPSETGKYLITSKNVKNGTISFEGSYYISETDFNAINTRSKVDKWDLLFTMIGTVGEVGIVTDEPDFAIKNVGLIKTGDETKAKFLKHFLTTSYTRKYVEENRSKGTQGFLALGKLRNIPVPNISKQKQERIVKMLDSFEIFATDTHKGLPAEISLRQKQYEYYRDKLLTFKPLS